MHGFKASSSLDINFEFKIINYGWLENKMDAYEEDVSKHIRSLRAHYY